jgi:transposase
MKQVDSSHIGAAPGIKPRLGETAQQSSAQMARLARVLERTNELLAELLEQDLGGLLAEMDEHNRAAAAELLGYLKGEYTRDLAREIAAALGGE